mgnify:FL=1
MATGAVAGRAPGKCTVSPVATPRKLTAQQVRFFDTFGYLRIPGLFAEDVAAIADAFEAVFAEAGNPRIDLSSVAVHGYRPRTTIPGFIDRHPTLAALRDDPRTVGVVSSILGDDYEYSQSDGNLYSCDTEWHCDIYGSPLHVRHIKLAFYLDSLDGDSGAPRVIPGTNHWQDPFAVSVRTACEEHIGTLEEVYGVPGPELPGVTLDVEPGDLLLWEYRTVHASYNGLDRRRLFTVNFREAV